MWRRHLEDPERHHSQIIGFHTQSHNIVSEKEASGGCVCDVAEAVSDRPDIQSV